MPSDRTQSTHNAAYHSLLFRKHSDSSSGIESMIDRLCSLAVELIYCNRGVTHPKDKILRRCQEQAEAVYELV